MTFNRLAAGAAAADFLAAFSAAAQAPAINVEKWPDDVPCDVLKKNPDGSYEITVPITRYYVTHRGHEVQKTPARPGIGIRSARAPRSSGADPG